MNVFGEPIVAPQVVAKTLKVGANGGKTAPASFTLSAAAGAANVCNVTIQAVDGEGTAIADVFAIEVWLSDSAAGAGLTSTTASGTVTAASGGGSDLTALTAKKHIRGVTNSSGAFILEITDTAKTTFYVATVVPSTGEVVVSDILATADYGS